VGNSLRKEEYFWDGQLWGVYLDFGGEKGEKAGGFSNGVEAFGRESQRRLSLLGWDTFIGSSRGGLEEKSFILRGFPIYGKRGDFGI